MIVHNFDPVLIDFGILQIRWYSLAYVGGIIAGWLYAIKIIKLTAQNKYNFIQIKTEQFDNLVVFIVLGIVLGGRLGYVFFYNFEYFIQNFVEIFKIWQGGMSFHGGLLGVIVAIYIFSKKNNTDFFKCADVISSVAPIGIFFGRIANFINGELYGKYSNLPWSVVFPGEGNISRHPSQIYEALLEGLILFLLLNYLALKKEFLFKAGYISSFFLIFYSIFRLFSEIFREPDKHIGLYFNYFSMGSLLSLITLFIGLFIIYSIKKDEQNT